MKRICCCVVLCCVVLLTGCFKEREKSEVSNSVEDKLITNAQKSLEVRENAVSDMLNFLDTNEKVKKYVKTRMSKDITAETSDTDKLNTYFDALDEMVLTESETKIIEEKVEKVELVYDKQMPKPIGEIFTNGNVPCGMGETIDAVTIGGDLLINKNVPENVELITNLVKEVNGEEILTKREFTKRGFYVTQSAFLWSNALWEKGRVKYRFAGNLDSKDKEIIYECMKNWEEASGGKIKFSGYRNNKWNRFRWKYGMSKHIEISKENIGNSNATLGRQVRAHLQINEKFLKKRADGSYIYIKEEIKSEILHELGHNLGLFHEQQRPDRDKYIIVNYQAAANHNNWSLDKAISQYGNIEKYGQKKTSEYDYYSIMHYWTSYDSLTKEYDIIRLDGKKIDRAMILSVLDKQFIKELYQ